MLVPKLEKGFPASTAKALMAFLEQLLSRLDTKVANWPLGTVDDGAGASVYFDPTFEYLRLIPYALAADTNDLDRIDFNWVYMDPAASYALTGMTNGEIGVHVWLTNTDATDSVTVKHQNSGSAAVDRFTCAGGVDYVIGPGQTALAIHDGTYWWIGTTAGGDAPVFGGPTTFLDNVFIEGSVLPGVSSSDITTLKTNLTDTEIKVLANLNGCQTQAFLTLTNVQQQLITSNLSVVQTGNLFASITTANASIIPTLLTGFTTAQLTTFANDFSSNIFITTGATPAQMISLLTTITNTQANTLTAAITQQQIGNLLVSMTAANISNLITNLTSTQWTAISVGFSPAQLEAATVNLTTIESLSAAQITSLAQYTPAQISALLTNLTAAQLQAFLTNANAKMDLTTIFNGQTSTSTNAAQNNVTAVNLLYLAYNPTGSSATITGFVPTSPQLPQIITVTNTNSTNSLVLVNASGSSTYPIKVPGGANYSLKPLTSVQLAFDPTTASWIAITAPEASTGSTGGLVKTTIYTSGGSPYTWTPQADTAIIVVEVLGDGGGGGWSTPGSGTCIGGGGGAGGYARSTIPAATYGASKTVTVGSGGAGGTSGAGIAGTGSSFGSLVTANGGGGGQSGYGASTFSQGGVGGTASGDLATPGANGGYGISVATINGMGGAGANSIYGAGGLPGLLSAGGSATGYGAGGGGSDTAGGFVPAVGGAGSGGLVIVNEYTLG
jgi:hypothetical protein